MNTHLLTTAQRFWCCSGPVCCQQGVVRESMEEVLPPEGLHVAAKRQHRSRLGQLGEGLRNGLACDSARQMGGQGSQR